METCVSTTLFFFSTCLLHICFLSDVSTPPFFLSACLLHTLFFPDMCAHQGKIIQKPFVWLYEKSYKSLCGYVPMWICAYGAKILQKPMRVCAYVDMCVWWKIRKNTKKSNQKLKNPTKHYKIQPKIKKSNQKLQPNEKKEIGMIAGGSGITPMYQVFLFFFFFLSFFLFFLLASIGDSGSWRCIVCVCVCVSSEITPMYCVCVCVCARACVTQAHTHTHTHTQHTHTQDTHVHADDSA